MKPEQLGDFRFLRELGNGGMGVVYLARQVSLERDVAVKVLKPHWTRTEIQVERFQREARAAARLHHPGIVPIHAVGQEDDAHYFAMDFIAGHSLAQELALQPNASELASGEAILPPFHSREYIPCVARLCAEVADALDYEHGEGIVHRDVKPGNIQGLGAPRARFLSYAPSLFESSPEHGHDCPLFSYFGAPCSLGDARRGRRRWVW